MWSGPSSHGTCDCDRDECSLARFVRAAAADRCAAAIVVEYGSTNLSPDFHLSVFPPHEWACRAFPWRSDRACPSCGYVPSKVPSWAVHGATFVLDNISYRIVSGTGSTNRYSPNRLHSEDYVICERSSGEKWSLPDLPATKADVGASLGVLFKLPKFRARDLERALRAV